MKAAAERRQVQQAAEAAAERLLAKAGTDRDPIEHLLGELHRSAAVASVWGSLVAKLDEAERQIDRAEEPTRARGLLAEKLTGEGGFEAIIHPFVIQWNGERDRHAKLAKMAIDVGISERQVKLAERQGELVAELLGVAMRAMGVSQQQAEVGYRAVRGHLTVVAPAAG